MANNNLCCEILLCSLVSGKDHFGSNIKVEYATHIEPPGGYGGYRGGGGGGGGFRGSGRGGGDFGGRGGGDRGDRGGGDRDRGGGDRGGRGRGSSFVQAAGDWECPDPK